MQIGYRFRLYFFTVLILVGVGGLLSRLHSFQIVQTETFRDQMPSTRTKSIREPGIRGDIVDRNGVVLAENLRRYEVIFNLEEIYKAYRQAKRTDSLPPEALPPKDRNPKKPLSISEIVDLFIIPHLKELDLAKDYSHRAMNSYYQTYGGHVPYSYRKDLTFQEFARFAEHLSSIPGVYLSSRPLRHYPQGSLASHLLGKLRSWDRVVPEEASKIYNYYVGEEKGVAGIELTMDEMLRGPEGARTIREDEKGKTIGLTDKLLPGQGATVTLTIDARIQTLVEKVLRRAGRAAVVVMNTNTGEVLAMASVPDYNPNDFVPPTNSAKLEAYNANQIASPFTNRAISSQVPGSTFKIPTALAGFRAGLGSCSIECKGHVDYRGIHVRCWIKKMYGSQHGMLTLPEAIQQSCNPYFNTLANRAGSEALVDTFEMLGFGKKTGIRLPGEKEGILLGSRHWRRVVQPGKFFSPILQAMLSIGQNDSGASPLQLAAMLSSVANGGKYYQPRIIKEVVDPNSGVMIEDKPILKTNLLEHGITAENLAEIREGMRMAAHVKKGTARRAAPKDVMIGAKTGTAQAREGNKTHNAWTIAFAPFEKPKYSIVVLVENGKSGGGVAGPLARRIIKGLIDLDQGVKLPVSRMQHYKGHLDFIEKMELPDDDPLLLAMDDVGETAPSPDQAAPENSPDQPNQAPTGTTPPRAVPVE